MGLALILRAIILRSKFSFDLGNPLAGQLAMESLVHQLSAHLAEVEMAVVRSIAQADWASVIGLYVLPLAVEALDFGFEGHSLQPPSCRRDDEQEHQHSNQQRDQGHQCSPPACSRFEVCNQ